MVFHKVSACRDRTSDRTVQQTFRVSQKCPYNVTFHLDLDLEHTLDAGPSGDHRVQVW